MSERTLARLAPSNALRLLLTLSLLPPSALVEADTCTARDRRGRSWRDDGRGSGVAAAAAATTLRNVVDGAAAAAAALPPPQQLRRNMADATCLPIALASMAPMNAGVAKEGMLAR